MKRILVALVLAIFAPATLAIPIKWELVDVELTDLTSVEGSFVFDADTLLMSAVDVSTQDGDTFRCATSDCDPTVPDPFPPGGSILGTAYELGGLSTVPGEIDVLYFILDTGGAGLGGTPLLSLHLDGPLTNSGGQVGLPTGLSVEFICDVGDDSCANTFDVQTIPFRANVEGGFIRAVPEPASLALLGIGRRTRIQQAQESVITAALT